MAADGVDAVLISTPASLAWLTGFTGSFGRAIVTARDAIFITDSRYTLQAIEEVADFDVRSFASPVNGDDFLAKVIAPLQLSAIGFESDGVAHGQWLKWRDKLGIELKPAPDYIARLRMIKTADEIAKIRVACAISDAAFDHIVRIIRPGITEIDVALELDFFMRRQGASPAFDTIAVSGERSARPHGHPSEKRLEDGDFLTMDFGACSHGYNSDMTRTVMVGRASERHREVYGIVLDAQLAALAMMKPGVAARDVDARVREMFTVHDLAKYFGHGLGHGLGRLVHDSGRMAPSSDDILTPGNIWTVEPGVYIPGFGGVRIEDDVVITETGIEILNRSTKELLELSG